MPTLGHTYQMRKFYRHTLDDVQQNLRWSINAKKDYEDQAGISSNNKRTNDETFNTNNVMGFLIFVVPATLTSPPALAACCCMLSREQGKQNLCAPTDGHCTKWVSSSRCWHSVHFKVGADSAPPPAAAPLTPLPPDDAAFEAGPPGPEAAAPGPADG